MYKPLVYNGIMYFNFLINKSGKIKNLDTNHVYKHAKDRSGYLMVYLPMGKRGKIKVVRVHKAVAETFLPNPNRYPIVHHKDENKGNPKLSNLEWTTSKGNTDHYVKSMIKKKIKLINIESLRKKILNLLEIQI